MKPQAENEKNGMLFWERLEANGWTKTYEAPRADYYRKGKWECYVPATTYGNIRFYRLYA